MHVRILGWTLLCGLALGLAACVDDENDDLGDGGMDSGTDAGTDTDSDADTDSETHTEPSGGTECGDPIEIPDEPLVWSYTFGWSGFVDDTFDTSDGGVTGCEENEGNTVWFHVTVPSGYEVVFHLNDGPVVWVYVIESCDATECLASNLATMTISPAWANGSGEDQVVYMAVESNVPILGEGTIDWTFERTAL
jgi:hypothetical protein